MEYDIYELMRGLQDDSVPLPEDGAADLRRIKELTMNKIQENQDAHGVRPIRRMTRMMLVAAIAAALCAAPVTVRGSETTSKSYPRFWDDLETMKGATP